MQSFNVVLVWFIGFVVGFCTGAVVALVLAGFLAASVNLAQ